MHKQAGKDQLFIAVLYLFFLKCVLFKKKIKNKKLATHIFIEDFLWKTIPDNMKNFCIKLFHEETANLVFNNA